MTGGGAPGGPGIIRCLQADKRIELIVCDVNNEASGRFLNDRFFQTLPASHPEFAEFMQQQCRDLEIDVLFPLVTRELFVLADRQTDFASAGTRVIVSGSHPLHIANDKGKLHQHLADRHLLVPDFRVVRTFQELERAFTELGYPAQKICIKPTVSNGSRGVRIIDPDANEYDLLFNEKPNSLYMRQEDLFRILEGRSFPELLVAEVLPGEEYTIDTLMNHGTCRLIVPRVRTRMSGGISVAGEIREHPEITTYIRQIADSLSLHGPIGYQVKKAADGRFKILEINPRIQGTSVALWGAGVNLPLLAVWQEAGIEFELPEVKWGVKFVRYYHEVYY